MSTTPLERADAVACTLAPDAYRNRLGDLAALASAALVSRQPIDGGERLTFTGGATTERLLRAAIAAEAACCSFLTMRLERRDGRLVLDVTGPVAAQPIIAELFPFPSDTRGISRRRARAGSRRPRAARTSSL